MSGKYELVSQEEKGGFPVPPQPKKTSCLVKVILALGIIGSIALLGYFLLPYLPHCFGSAPTAEPAVPGDVTPVDPSNPFPPITIQCISDHASQGKCSTTALCCTGCCSRYGYCGTGSEYCGDGCQSTCSGGGGGGEAVSWNTMWCGFSAVGPGESRLRSIHSALNAAVKKMGISFGESVSKVEVAAYLGQISHESDYLRAKREYCSLPGANPSCLTNYDYGSWCPEIKPAPGKHYYGRGFIQLTWNCNYDHAGKYLNRPLLADPDQVEISDQVAWETAFYYWVVNKCQTPAREGRFGATTKIINSGECNGGNRAAQDSRVRRYQDMRKCLGMPTESNSNLLYC